MKVVTTFSLRSNGQQTVELHYYYKLKRYFYVITWKQIYYDINKAGML